MNEFEIETPDEVKALKKLVGDWKLDIKITMPDGSMLSGSGNAQAKPVAMGQGVHMILKANVPGLGDIEEHDLIGYNASGDQKIHLFSLVSSGTVHDHVGTWKDENTMQVQWQGVEDGKLVHELDIFSWTSSKELRIVQRETVEGQPGLYGEYILRKVH